jgi:hypothetical protein
MKRKKQRMKGEIDKDFYCSTLFNKIGGLNLSSKCYGARNNACEGCPARHRKHPTPEQYKEEYGTEYPDGGAVYLKRENIDGWDIMPFLQAKDLQASYKSREYKIVCACTPWGKAAR